MKLLISASGDDIKSNIDTTFHWSYCFLVLYNSDNSTISLDNKIKNHQNLIEDIINEFVKNEGIEAVITYEIGSKVFKFLKQHRVKIYHSSGKIIHAIKKLENGNLLEIKET
jgi:predicted Fe-Mo cluster-binding NifX family protein